MNNTQLFVERLANVGNVLLTIGDMLYTAFAVAVGLLVVVFVSYLSWVLVRQFIVNPLFQKKRV
jgi:type III secretory pathway component EscR